MCRFALSTTARPLAALLTRLALLLAILPTAQAEQYFFGFLKSAPDRQSLPKQEQMPMQLAHLGHLEAMAKLGKLVAAGPFGNGGVFRGVIIYKTETLAEAQKLADQDPLVQRKQLVAELFPWQGPKGIGEEYARLVKVAGGDPKVGMRKFHLVLTPASPAAANALLQTARQSGRLYTHGPLDDGRHLLILEPLEPAALAEFTAALAGNPVPVLEWYVANHVLVKNN